MQPNGQLFFGLFLGLLFALGDVVDGDFEMVNDDAGELLDVVEDVIT